jgi:hypothetical protein
MRSSVLLASAELLSERARRLLCLVKTGDELLMPRCRDPEPILAERPPSDWPLPCRNLGMISSMRRIAAPLFVLTALAGGSATVALGERTQRITKTEAVAYARAVNLAAGDVPGWKDLGLAPEPEPATNTSDPQFARCTGGKPIRYVAQVESPQFVLGTFGVRAELVASKITVAPTSSLAARGMAVLRTARGPCFKRLIRAEPGGGRVRLRLDRVSWSPLRQLPVANRFEVRIAWTAFGLRRSPLRFYIDVLGFAYGPAQVFLIVQGSGLPVPATTADRLVSVLYSRATAHRL